MEEEGVVGAGFGVGIEEGMERSEECRKSKGSQEGHGGVVSW